MSKRPHALLGVLGLSSMLGGCGAGEPLPPVPPAVELAPPAPLPPPAPPPLLVIPRAEPSPQRVPDPKAPDVAALRSQGRRHVLARTADGIVVLSEDRGVLGFLKSPVPGAEIRWAGFVDDDAILVATKDTLHRAATADDAVAGKLDPQGELDPAATRIASSGKVVVAAAPGADGALHESRDGGRHFSIAKRPAKGPIVDLTVRSDGAVVAAVEREKIVNEHGRAGVRADIYVARRPGAWVKGPTVRAFYGHFLNHQGDSIVVSAEAKKGNPSSVDTLGLDAGGRWIATGYPGSWLSFSWTSARFDVDVPVSRPGFPRPRAKGDLSDLLGGLMGSGSGGGGCRGVDCLARRSLARTPPHVRAFRDGVCAKEHVISRSEKVHILSSLGGAGHDETRAYRECDPGASARRAATLLVRAGDDRRLVRLPVSCAAGDIVGTDRASFVHCTSKHAGRPSIQHVSPAGALTEVASVSPDLELAGAESATDGTTLLFAKEAVWLCRTADAPACAPVPQDGFVAARPLPGGRALVARRGPTERDLVLELLGEPGSPRLRVSVHEQVLEIEVTAEGWVRLWMSRSLRWFPSPEALARRKDDATLGAFLVLADGRLIGDQAANEALARAVDAARARR